MQNLTNDQLQAQYDEARDAVNAGNTREERLELVDQLDRLEDEAATRGFWLTRN